MTKQVWENSIVDCLLKQSCAVFISRLFSSSTASLNIWLSAIFSPVIFFTTEASDCDTEQTYAAFIWSPAYLIPTPVLRIEREPCFQTPPAITVITILSIVLILRHILQHIRVSKSCNKNISENSSDIFYVTSQVIYHLWDTKTASKNSKSTLWILQIGKVVEQFLYFFVWFKGASTKLGVPMAAPIVPSSDFLFLFFLLSIALKSRVTRAHIFLSSVRNHNLLPK